MVGWSRRNRESSERRQRWWNSLTPEQKEQARAREAAFDRKLAQVGTLFLIFLVFVYLAVEAYRWVVR